MQRVTHLLMLASVLAMGILSAVPAAGDMPIFDIPRLDGIAIDGDPGDWGNRGLRVGPLLTLEKHVRPPQNFDQRFRLGWTPDGLLFLGIVRDQIPCEASDNRLIGAGDAVELFLGVKRGLPGFYQIQISPGADPRFPQARTNAFDLRPDADKLPPLTVTAAGRAGRRPWCALARCRTRG